MIPALLGQLGARLTDRWASLVVLPGLLYVGVATLAGVLGQRHWRDVGAARAWVDRVADAPGLSTAGGVILTLGGILVAANAAGLAARLLGVLTLRWWLGAWPPPLHRLAGWATGRRRRRWSGLQDRFSSAALANPRQESLARQLAHARNRIAAAQPRRPTWMGDRLAAVETRVEAAYGLDLVSCWPRTWLIIPESTRAEVNSARAEVDGAATLAGWAALYLPLAVLWWPAAVIGLLTWLTAYRAGRHAVAVHADLVESVLDLHSTTLARALGVEGTGTMTPDDGREVTRRLRKGS
jgi:hypothetical protein